MTNFILWYQSGTMVFVMNSDWPYEEIQNITQYPSQYHEKIDIVNCTYLEIPKVDETYETYEKERIWLMYSE